MYHWGSLWIWKAKIGSNLLYPGPFLLPSEILFLTLYYSNSISHFKWCRTIVPNLNPKKSEYKDNKSAPTEKETNNDLYQLILFPTHNKTNVLHKTSTCTQVWWVICCNVQLCLFVWLWSLDTKKKQWRVRS